MEPITLMAFDLTPAAGPAASANLAAGSVTPTMFDVSQFNAAFAAARAPAATPSVPQVSAGESAGFRSVVAALGTLDGRADTIGAKALEMSGGDLKPGEMLMMTMRAHEFLFHCEMTSNVANRSSDGVQQLFREQT
jgi:hypothetical protein